MNHSGKEGVSVAIPDHNQIVETYGTLVYRIALARMAKREDAEDVFQEVLAFA